MRSRREGSKGPRHGGILDTERDAALAGGAASNDAQVRAARDKYAELFDFAPDGYFALHQDSRVAETNLAGMALFGLERERLLKARFADFVTSGDQSKFTQFLTDVFSSPESKSCRVQLQMEDGRSPIVEIHASTRGFDHAPGLCHALVSDVSVECEHQRRQQLLLDLLDVINRAESRRSLVAGVTRTVADWLECEALGIRLHMGDDYPYYETRGFGREFLEAERSLCTTNSLGEVLRDSQGRPVLECMCGNVISGRFDPALPFFTSGGSFWSNGTTTLLATSTETERQSPTRNRCNAEGYESVALIPLRYNQITFGLLQINDHRKDLFSRDLISFLEMIASYIAIALSRRLMEAELVESEEKFRRVVETAIEGILIINAKWITTYANPQMAALLGRRPEELIGRPIAEFVHSDDHQILERQMELREAGKDGRYEIRCYRSNGAVIWCQVSSTPIMNSENEFAGTTAMCTDITDRRQGRLDLEQAYSLLDTERTALKDKNVALKEVLDHIESEKKRIREQMSANTDVVIAPLLANLKGRIGQEFHGHVEMIQKALEEITSPFANDLSKRFATLSPREVQVCTMIKNGSLSKEIADYLGVSIQTVHKFRQRIRRKLGITNDDVDLSQILRSM